MKKLTYISLFSSAGVGCYGFKQEDFDCIATAELIPRRLDIQKYNNTCNLESGYIAGDLTTEETKNKIYTEIDRWNNISHNKDIDVIVATPPCQGISVANLKKKDEKKRNSLVVESIKITSKVNPRIFIFENVRGFLKTICTDIDEKDKTIKEAIELNLGGRYNILFKVVNFKDYGNPSSRTRTLVIGIRKDILDISPYDIFPDKSQELVLKDSIGDLISLQRGETDLTDIYHNFREYPEYMLSWIKELKEGESAFENKDPKKKPHKFVDGKRVENQNKSGDKYRRWYWNKVGPCIHTRNDQLASQCTIHPTDNRVFSIRELMRMMSIPDSFKWSELSLKELNDFNKEEKRNFLKKNEMNIRQCIGEAVPTIIFRQIAHKIKNVFVKEKLTENEVKKIIIKNKLDILENLINYLHSNLNLYSYSELSKIAELANAERLHTAAYYTRQDICFTLIKDLPDASYYKKLRILEPSVGVGNFLPFLIKKYEETAVVTIDVVDIDKNAIDILKILITKLSLPPNITINYIHDDFLLHKFDEKYNIVIGNPPFGKIIKDPTILKLYKGDKKNNDSNNIFAFFIEKAMGLGSLIALIGPKSLISAPDFNKTRLLLEKIKISQIVDYGEKAFKGVKIETIGISIDTQKSSKDTIIKVESYILNSVKMLPQTYVMDKDLPYWILYRDIFFDQVTKKLKFGIFNVFRDRQITKKITKNKGKMRVLKSRNIGNNQIIDIKNYDSFIDDISNLAVSKFINNTKAVLVPNLTYYPRAVFMPNDIIVDGSVAILTPKNGTIITKKDLAYFASEEFSTFYKIARNYGTRSLNIDSNSVFFWGVTSKN